MLRRLNQLDIFHKIVFDKIIIVNEFALLQILNRGY
jgi:hypothetical protein